MQQQLINIIAPILAILWPVVFAAAFGIAIRKARFLNRKTEEKFAKFLEGFALKVFLPLFVYESIAKSTLSSDFLVAFLVGFALPVICLACISALASIASARKILPSNYNEFRFGASTFGGGNRGMAIFILLFSSRPDFADYLKWFSLVDLGNFACLLTVIALLVKKQYGKKGSSEIGWLKWLRDDYTVVTVLVVVLLFLLRVFLPSIDQILGNFVQERKTLFTVFVFIALTLRFDPGTAAKTFLHDLTALFFVRVLAGVTLAVVLVPLFPDLFPAYIAAAILLLMPPSSILPSMISNRNASSSAISYVSNFSASTNLAYLFIVAIGVIFAVTQAF